MLERIGNYLRLKRIERGDKMETTARAVGLSKSVISQIENGRYQSLMIKHLEKLARYYDITIEEIVSIKAFNS